MKSNISIREITKIDAMELIFDNHYSKILPRITKYYLGGFENQKLIGVMTLGYGVRPKHTIKLLFPSMEVKNYLEIGKLCLLETMPKNSESQFISKCLDWIKLNKPNIKIIFTWADGILGKPGYVYQATNAKYGGYIWTDLYISDKGEKIHPRTSQTLSDKGNTKYGHRPTRSDLKLKGWSHFRGKQFRYIYIIGDKREKKQLLKESLIDWKQTYPKAIDLEWKIQDLDTGEWGPTTSITYDAGAANNNNRTVKLNTKKIEAIKTLRTFFNF